MHTGRVLHIDFGDCFEVAMQREKYPEKIPFRLTRMMINAMEVSGIEGTFRFTCENIMEVLRDNKESLMAVLEAFVYDPIINWRLLATSPAEPNKQPTQPNKQTNMTNVNNNTNINTNIPTNSNIANVPNFESNLGGVDSNFLSTSFSRHGQKYEAAHAGDPEINRRAVKAMNRVVQKLNGRDFPNENALAVPDQIEKLIKMATSHENLCQCYVGWCPFW